jgi:hypothetical protein
MAARAYFLAMDSSIANVNVVLMRRVHAHRTLRGAAGAIKKD